MRNVGSAGILIQPGPFPNRREVSRVIVRAHNVRIDCSELRIPAKRTNYSGMIFQKMPAILRILIFLGPFEFRSAGVCLLFVFSFSAESLAKSPTTRTHERFRMILHKLEVSRKIWIMDNILTFPRQFWNRTGL